MLEGAIDNALELGCQRLRSGLRLALRQSQESFHAAQSPYLPLSPCPWYANTFRGSMQLKWGRFREIPANGGMCSFASSNCQLYSTMLAC